MTIDAFHHAPQPVSFRTDTFIGHQLLWFLIESGRIDPPALTDLRLPPLDESRGVIVSGRGPIWLVCRIYSLLGRHPWVAQYEPRLGSGIVIRAAGALVAGSLELGSLVALSDTGNSGAGTAAVPQRAAGAASARGHAIAVVGPPHSGKSVLIAGLQRALQRASMTWFVLRVAPDGEGLWSQESEEDIVRQVRHKKKWTEQGVAWNVAAIETLREGYELVLVDTGGRIDPFMERVLGACSHAVVLANTSEDGQRAAEDWCAAAARLGVAVLARLESKLDAQQTVLDETGDLIRGVVAGLDRDNRSPEDSARPLLEAIARRLGARA